MSLLARFLESGLPVVVETTDVVISSVSDEMTGEYGAYRIVVFNNISKIVKTHKIVALEHYAAGCTASVTLKEFEKDGVTDISCIALVFKAQ